MKRIKKLINNDEAFKQRVIDELISSQTGSMQLQRTNSMKNNEGKKFQDTNEYHASKQLKTISVNSNSYNQTRNTMLSHEKCLQRKEEDKELEKALELSKRTELDEMKEFEDMNEAIKRSKLQEEIMKKKEIDDYNLKKEKIDKMKFVKSIIEEVKTIIKTNVFNELALNQLKNLVKIFESKTYKKPIGISDDELNGFEQDKNEISILALKLCHIIDPEINFHLIKKLINFFEDHIEWIKSETIDKSVCVFDKNKNQVDIEVNCLSHSFLMAFERVKIKGDGNCLWHSISVALFGDYSFMESLRLLTAETLIKNEDYFRKHLANSIEKYGYKHELSYEGLINASIQLGVWGDEYHLFTLSVALRRPIYSYGSFKTIDSFPDEQYFSYERFKKVYEELDFINHYSYVGYKEDESREPVCIYYNGETHYCAILPKNAEMYDPIKPKTTLFDHLIEKYDVNLQSESLKKKLYSDSNNK